MASSPTVSHWISSSQKKRNPSISPTAIASLAACKAILLSDILVLRHGHHRRLRALYCALPAQGGGGDMPHRAGTRELPPTIRLIVAVEFFVGSGNERPFGNHRNILRLACVQQ